ncbi:MULTISPECIES: hypothetical protein [Sphingobium]|uniref:hypothetical protein n=1 Tax=Sphingobium TaxID=165695 RepID=UPI000E7645DB|nr:hypothetical protein [Sphingobium sp. YG1]
MRGKTLILAVGSLALAPQLSRAQDMEARARAAAAASRAKSGDSDAITNSYVNPGLAGEAISTVDSNRQFTTNLACQKSATMLEVLVQPGSTGDIIQLSVARDSNLDGSFDQNLTLPIPVSGICANGVLSCDPGSWNNCTPFKWDVSSAGDLKLAQVPLTDLSACYCINASCGSNLVLGNLNSVLKDLGGGVIGALTTADPRIGVAQTSIEGPVIRYIGAQTTACTSSPSVSATTYLANPTAIAGDASATAQGSSVFQTLAGSPSASGKAQETRACTIAREINISDPNFDAVIARSGGRSTLAVSPTVARFQMGSPGEKSLTGGRCSIFEFQMTLTVGDRDRLRGVRLVRYYADDWAQITVDGTLVASGPQSWTGAGLPPGNCEQGRIFTRTPGTDLLPFMTPGAHEIRMRVAVADEGGALAEIEAEIDDSCSVDERLVDLCSPYAQDQDCRLILEEVDGVETFRNGVNTGLKPLAQTRRFGAGQCSYQFTRDFFERRRRYACVTDSAALAEPDLTRSAYIIDHSTETLLADRTASSDGTISTSTREFSLPDRGSVPACEPVCKTRAPKVNSDVAVSGAVGAAQNDPAGWNSFYHSCTADNVCPLGEGEELVTACGCLDDFPEAAVMMQTVRLAGSDLACTAGTP